MRSLIIAILTTVVSCVSCASRNPDVRVLTKEYSPVGKSFYIDCSTGYLWRFNWYLTFPNDSILEIVCFKPGGARYDSIPRHYRQLHKNTFVYNKPEFGKIFRDADTLYYYGNIGMIASRYTSFIDREVEIKYYNDTVWILDTVSSMEQLEYERFNDKRKRTEFMKELLVDDIIHGKVSDIQLEYHFSDSPHRNITVSFNRHKLKIVCTSDLFEPVIEEYECSLLSNSVHVNGLISSNRDSVSEHDVVQPFANTDNLTPSTAFPRFDKIGMRLLSCRVPYDVLNYHNFIFTRKDSDKVNKAKLKVRPIDIGYEFYVNGILRDTIFNRAELIRRYPNFTPVSTLHKIGLGITRPHSR